MPFVSTHIAHIHARSCVMRCSVLQCVAVCCSVLQCVAVCVALPFVSTHSSPTCALYVPCFTVCCSVLQLVASANSMYLNLNSYSNLQSLNPISNSILNLNAENIHPGRCRSSTRRRQHRNLSRSLLHSCNGPPSSLPAWHYIRPPYMRTRASAAECLALLGLLNM